MAPVMAKKIASLIPLWASGMVAITSDSAAENKNAAPTPWRTRNAMIQASEEPFTGVNPHAADEAANRRVPKRTIFL